MKLNFNRQVVGFIVGLIAPMLVMTCFYLVKYSRFTIVEFLNLILGAGIFIPLMSLSVIINLLLFFIFLWTNKDYAARGVILATMVYAFTVIIFKTIS